MSELTLTVVRFGLVALLWVFVFSIVGVIRSDLYGTRIVQRSGGGRSKVRPTPNAPSGRGARKFTKLVVTDGPGRGSTVPLKESGTLLGRNPECSLVLDDDYASGRHCRIFADDRGWWVEDLQSTNGTWVDRDRVHDVRPLGEGSHLRIGNTVLELRR